MKRKCEALREPRGNVMGQSPCVRSAMDEPTSYLGRDRWLCWQHRKMALRPSGFVALED